MTSIKPPSKPNQLTSRPISAPFILPALALRQADDPGGAYQFDWSHEIVVMDGVAATVKVAHIRICHSRMMFVRAYPRETWEMVFDTRDRWIAGGGSRL